MSANARDTLQSIGLLVLRLGAGGLLVYGHGWDKLTHFAERASTFPTPIGLGPTASFTLVVFAEAICSVLVALGLVTRLAAVPPVIFFCVAAFIQHAADPWAKKELALVYLVPFLAILFMGGGRFALDTLIFKKRGSRP